MNDTNAIAEFNRAQAFAYWSFAGLIMPILGIILGCLSRATLRGLSPSSEQEQSEMQRVWRLANWGIGLGIAGTIIVFVAAVISASMSMQSTAL